MKQLTCPEPVELMIWLDEESLEPQAITEHLQSCNHCQELVGQMREENLAYFHCLEAITTPDFSRRIMNQILTTSPDTKLFYNVLWYLLLVITTTSSALTYYLANPILQADSWAIAGAKLYAAITNLYFIVDSIRLYLLTQAIPSKPLLPALTLMIVILLIQLYSKRRYSNA